MACLAQGCARRVFILNRWGNHIACAYIMHTCRWFQCCAAGCDCCWGGCSPNDVHSAQRAHVHRRISPFWLFLFFIFFFLIRCARCLGFYLGHAKNQNKKLGDTSHFLQSFSLGLSRSLNSLRARTIGARSHSSWRCAAQYHRQHVYTPSYNHTVKPFSGPWPDLTKNISYRLKQLPNANASTNSSEMCTQSLTHPPPGMAMSPLVERLFYWSILVGGDWCALNIDGFMS